MMPRRARTWAVVLVLLTVATSHLFGDSLWRDNRVSAMVGDKRAAAVGDILSVVVQENSTATKDNKTKTSKQSAIDSSLQAFIYSPAASKLLTKGGTLPAVKLNGNQSFDGGGTINNSENIIARIAVQVVDVLPNRNLVIEGRRQTSFAGETQEAILRGIVRPADITANNTVFSYNVADACIKLVSKGNISDSQRKGWFTRIWEKLAPF